MPLTISAQAAPWVWLLGCVKPAARGAVPLVAGMGVKSAKFAMLCLYSAAPAAYPALPSAGRRGLAAVPLLWFSVRFFRRWHYGLFVGVPFEGSPTRDPLFGAGERK